MSKNRDFSSGARRDNDHGKLRMSLIPQEALNRVLKRYLDGAEKYGENKYQLIAPISWTNDKISKSVR